MEFKRVNEAFDVMAIGTRLCKNNGSGLTDLSNLVNSFLERENSYEEVFYLDEENDKKEVEEGNKLNCIETEIKDDLIRLLRIGNDDGDGEKMNIHAVVEEACREVGDILASPASFKRRLMVLLRDRGIDAGICKSKWENKCDCPPGTHDYIDVISNSRRFIVEVSLASQFEIARSTKSYVSLLQFFPQIFVGEVGEIKKIVRLMCDSIKTSMKIGGISVPPWRRFSYMQEKWLGPYKRTINEVHEVTNKDLEDDLATMRSIGFEAVKAPISWCFREDVRRGDGRKVGNLALALAAI
ncbi:hypothetical protein Leryth_024900 [Lithospermum erythrorhizon]|uniref:DUF506 family protein n=1 Tax=Lithospermum erythrorhizon TaxID=34254 RepID=A0AAV3QIV6_LITER|nr:hypothetical protein Leryth_024900 [Lithospermum erythrorhizon]